MDSEVFWWFELVGVVVGCLVLLDWLCEFYYILRALCARKDMKKYGKGSWALITGASDGIGLGFAQALAKEGFNIVLVSRDPNKLAKVEDEIKREHSVEVLSISKDFSACPADPYKFFEDINERTKHLDVSILVNNIGAMSTGLFHKTPERNILLMNALNLWPLAFLSKMFLHRMVKRNKASAIFNLGSTNSMLPISGSTMYCNGKSFDHLFSLTSYEEIRYHVKKYGLHDVDIVSIMPGPVDTALSKVVKGRPMMITLKQCSDAAMSVVGKVNWTNAHWKHILLFTALRNMPRAMISKTFLKDHQEFH